MPAIKTILRRLGLPDRSEAMEREVEDELRFHIEMRTRDNVEAGMSPEEAAADAMRRFGDFDHIRAICGEIRKERLTSVMKVIRGITWVMIGCGLTLKLTSNVGTIRDVGFFLIVIALLWRLLVHLRQTQPSQQHIKAAEQAPLSITHTIGDLSTGSQAEQSVNPVRAYDKDGRTPVQRMLSDE
jgi:hypothetical protein